MSTFNVPSSFPTIVSAVASPLVNNGDTIEITAGYTETLTATLTIGKNLTFIGLGASPGSQLVQTAGTAGDPTQMITITNDVQFVNMEFRHLKTTNTGTERIFNSNALNELRLDRCNLNHMEFGIVGIYKNLRVLNCNFDISNSSPLNQNVHMSLTGISQIFEINGNTFDSLASATQTRFISISANGSFPIGNGGDCELNVWNNTHVGTSLLCGVFFSRWDFMGTGKLSLDCRNNNWTCPSNGLGCYRINSVVSDVNILNNFKDIRFSNNRHNAIGIGMCSVGGTTPVSPKTLGAITGDWTICNNQISGSINSASYSVYHFGLPQRNKILGVQNIVYINPFPTPNPYQPYRNCGAEFQANYMLNQFNDEILWRAYKTKSPHKNRAEMKL
jgi:hypothetical protein